jgi:metal-responsive CopG/Arc/MetJ family transcriptional regulator
MTNKEPASVSLPPELVAWVDRHHAINGFASRSALVQTALEEKRAELEEDEDE